MSIIMSRMSAVGALTVAYLLLVVAAGCPWSEAKKEPAPVKSPVHQPEETAPKPSIEKPAAAVPTSPVATASPVKKSPPKSPVLPASAPLAAPAVEKDTKVQTTGGTVASGNPLRSGNDTFDKGLAPIQPEPPPTTKTSQNPVASSDLHPLPEKTPKLVPVPEEPPKSASELKIVPPTEQGKPPAATGRPRPSNRSTTPFDAVKENGPIFVGWPKPQLALVITGRQDGYLEPCGCAGLDRMKGGMSRRHTFFQMLRNQGWPVVRLDVGDLVKGFGLQAELKFQIAVEAMRKMNYQGVTLGPLDLKLPAGVVVAQVVNRRPAPSSPPTSGCSALPPESCAPYRIVAAGGKKSPLPAF